MMEERAAAAGMLAAESEAAGLVPGPVAVESAVSASGIAVHGFRAERRSVRAAWTWWRDRHDMTGLVPFVTTLAPRALVEHDRGDEPWSGGSRDLLDSALRAVPSEVMAELRASRLREMTDLYVPPQDDADRKEIEECELLFDPEAVAAEIAARPEPGPESTARTGLEGEPVWLNFVEAKAGYELPALFPGLVRTPNWSGHQDRQLLPADHVAVLRHWHERYGAEFCFADSSTLELAVSRPPLNLLEIARAAVEQYAYCPDLGDAAIAGDQVRRSVWTFWWD
ncbi:DUF4253 domain-containing protein [Streptomyces sp. NPDC006482]|uniref:DUF4253 domain-containing protein n=1 Tax=Streptomyces sp. NPDC006482 TaxID=3154306 RepID=UPI0033AF3CB1